MSSENPVGIYCPQLPLPLNYEGMQYTYPEVTIRASDSEATSSTLPPSLTAFLVGFLQQSCRRNAAEAPKLAEEVDLKSQIVVCHKVGHSTTYDHSYQGETTAHAAHNAPATYFTSLHMATDPNWYHHLINELSNLNMRADEYTDNDQIRVGNKQGPQFRDVTAPRAK